MSAETPDGCECKPGYVCIPCAVRSRTAYLVTPDVPKATDDEPAEPQMADRIREAFAAGYRFGCDNDDWEIPFAMWTSDSATDTISPVSEPRAALSPTCEHLRYALESIANDEQPFHACTHSEDAREALRDAGIERTPSTADAIPNPTANANERRAAESQKTTPCGAVAEHVRVVAERIARDVWGGEPTSAQVEAIEREILAYAATEFRPLIEAAKRVWNTIPGENTEAERNAHAHALLRLRDALRTIEEDA